MLNLAGAAVYALVMLLAILAARRSSGHGQRHWWVLAAVFALLAAWRLAEGEAMVQDWLRSIAHAEHVYEQRRTLQRPLASLGIVALAVVIGWLAFERRAAPAIHWSRAATVGLLGLSTVRAISLHTLDVMLYTRLGLFSLNHVLDIGLAATVGWFALRTIRQRGA